VLTLLVILAFGGFLLWSTLSSQRAECTVTVAFNDAQNSATASAASETDATREAQTAACGPLAHGMNESIACGRIPPVSRQCRPL
jgi:ABC-type nickel/cobalt efflux system permease component RcnA